MRRRPLLAWIDATLDQDLSVPEPSTLEAARMLHGHKGWAVGIIDLEEALLDDTVERVNITLPRRVLRRLEDMARRAGQTRSGLIARLTVAPPPREDAPRRRRVR